MDDLDEDPTEALTGQTLGERYELLRPLGRGGMGVVFQARHLLLKKLVAVKVLRADRVTTKTALARFHREAAAAASIGDPHIVDVTDYGFTDDGVAYIVMEQLEGSDLRAIIQDEGALELDRFRFLCKQMLNALSSAHTRGIVHRDLKPDNVFVTHLDGKEFVKLLDFGISKLLITDSDSDTWITSTDVIMGTPYYMAPEQARHSSGVDHRADIYSMGVIMYQMLTGEVPFSGATPLEVLMKHVQEPPVSPRERRPEREIPADIDALVMSALAKDPAHRPATTDEMLAVLDGAPVIRREPAPVAPRGRTAAMITGGALVLVLAALLLLKLYSVDPPVSSGPRGACSRIGGPLALQARPPPTPRPWSPPPPTPLPPPTPGPRPPRRRTPPRRRSPRIPPRPGSGGRPGPDARSVPRRTGPPHPPRFGRRTPQGGQAPP